MLNVFQRWVPLLKWYYIHFWEPPPPSSFIFAYLIIEAGRPAGAISLCSMSFQELYQENVITTIRFNFHHYIIICSHTYFSNDSDVLQVTGSNLQGRMCHVSRAFGVFLLTGTLCTGYVYCNFSLKCQKTFCSWLFHVVFIIILPYFAKHTRTFSAKDIMCV